MNFPNFPQNNTNYDQRQIINFEIKWPMFVCGVVCGVVCGIFAVYLFIDSEKVAICSDNSNFICTLEDGEIIVEDRKTGVEICKNLQKDYLGCLQTMSKNTEPQQKPATKPNRRKHTPVEECQDGDCPPYGEPTRY